MTNTAQIKGLKTISIAVLVLGLFSFSQNLVKAQEGDVTVAPARQIIQVDPGDTKNLLIKFVNQSDTPLPGTFGVADFIVTDKDGSATFLDNPNGASSRFSAKDWVTLPFSKGILPKRERLDLTFTLNVPKDAIPGGRYFGVFFQPDSGIPAKTGFEYDAGSGIQTRLVGLIYVRVSGPIEENAIVSRLAVPSFIEYGPVSVSTEILNRGNYHITPNADVYLYDMLGRRVKSVKLEEKNIFPDTARSYDVELGNKLMVGKFTVKVNALYGENGQVATTQTSFWAFPVRLFIAIVLTVILIALLAIFIWKSLKKKQNVLEKKLEEEISELESLKTKFKDSLPKK